jgi:hypothetical protein
MAFASRKSRIGFVLCMSEPGVSGGCVADPVARAKGDRIKALDTFTIPLGGRNRRVVSTRRKTWRKVGVVSIAGRRLVGATAIREETTMKAIWPEIPFVAWRETCAALHLYSQVVGKYRLARTPWLNHSWHATFYVEARGLSTSLVPDNAGIEITFDLVKHVLIGEAADGRSENIPLGPMSVADFHARFRDLIARLGGTPEFDGRPNETADAIPFRDDKQMRPYDADAVTRFFHALVAVSRVLSSFRTGFIGKVSPVHLFWGSFDLAVTRFSGRRAPLHPGGIPNLPDTVTREAYSDEVSSAGFWPGGGGTDFPAFYSYAYPTPKRFGDAPVLPAGAYFDSKLGEFILPYDVARTSTDPEAALMAFLESTYRAAADLAHWDRDALECAIGSPLQPRPLK